MDTSASSLIEKRKQLLGDAYRLFYREPLHIVRGKGAWLYDESGERYLDCYNNVPHVGHCHPRVVKAISEQTATLNTHTRYLHENVLDYAEMLLDLYPDDINVAMFGCSGTEANELALRIAREASGNHGIIVTRNAYHGTSWSISQLSPEDTPVDALEDHVALVDVPRLYRDGLSPEEAASAFQRSMEQAISDLKARGHAPAAFFMDMVLSSEGILDLPRGLIQPAIGVLRDAGGLFVADEVQSGFARTGTGFWGWENQGVEPDIATMGKPMGNGYPISGMVSRREHVEKFCETYHYFNTFGGNPVACAAARAVLEVIEKEKLRANANYRNEEIVFGLRALAERYDCIGDVRGSGLFIGAEIVSDRESRTPDGELASDIQNRMKEKGVLHGVAGPDANVLKVRPPMVLSREQGDLLLERLNETLEELS